MWGNAGVPPSAPSIPPKYQQNWARPESGKPVEDVGVYAGRGDAEHNNDNILAALETSTNNLTPSSISDKILLEDIVWKQRSGLGKYSFGFLTNEWEKRRVVLLESGMLRYYELGKDGIKYDPLHSISPKKSPWVYDTNHEPRGQLYLKCRLCTDGDRDGGTPLSSSSFDKDKSPNVGGVTVHTRDPGDDSGPTPFEIDITRNDNNETWRFCFECQSLQILWFSMLKSFAPEAPDDNIPSEGLANHGFEAGDHIIRWELLPVLYPIQIHGIVLEAGRNCVVIADFGLASSYQRAACDKNLTTWSEDESKDDSHDVIMAAWEKIKPKQKKRLNVVVVTDPKEIRKWSKINYIGGQGEKSNNKTLGFFTSLLSGKPQNTKESMQEIVSKETDAELSCSDDERNVEGEPEWIRPGYRPHKQKGSSMPLSNGQSVFSINSPGDQPERELPKSDSARLVLARTHFVLEHEEELPPYHVFYSNSECIAVWCKTGRWSTLQAAVYLVSTSVGWGKSATMITLSVAAAHAVLLPALAVGGLAVAGAPLLFLKKSQEQWDKTTNRLTEKFWMSAEPPVFVEAIKYWAKLD
ncbi:hypothetical protein ACHAXA_003569 [Cyclostephanos tholiformis]